MIKGDIIEFELITNDMKYIVMDIEYNYVTVINTRDKLINNLLNVCIKYNNK